MAQDLVPQAPPGALDRPTFLPKEDNRGTETITREDMQVPRLAIAQGLSPQIKREDPKYIQGLQLGDMFNSVTGQNVGRGPISFTVLRADPPRWIEFIPRSEGGGVRDMNVPPHDPRTQFRRNSETGESEPPIATKFYDFVIVTLPLAPNPMDSVIALSMKSTGLKVARELNTLLKMRGTASFAGKYTVASVPERNAKGEYYNYQVKNDGWILEEATFRVLEKMYEVLKTKQVTIDREATEEGAPEDFNYGENVAGQAPKNAPGDM